MIRPGSPRTNDKRKPRAPLLQRMHLSGDANELGAWAAALTLLAYPPAAHALVTESAVTGRPVDPCTRLLPGWLTAVWGSPHDVRGLRGQARRRHPQTL